MKKLDIEQAEKVRKKFLSDWEIRKGTYLYKKIALDDYNQVLRFLMYLEKPQIKLDHFADFMNFYNELTIMVTTHDVKGLTELDFELALYIDDAIKKMGGKQLEESLSEKWSEKYKRSINCSNPKGFSQKAHCAGRKKNESKEDDVEKMRGFDPETMQALIALKKKYPQANDPLDALLKAVSVNDRDSDTNDLDHDLKLAAIDDKIKDLEKQIKTLKRGN
jgi:4a-hydroxytetrahydrobiopterin dehydratase